MTRHKTLQPSTVTPPFSRYSHGVEVAPDVRWLYISGQVGVRPDGAIAVGSEAQLEQCFANLLAVLSEAGMGPASTLLVISALAHPDLLVAVEAVAAA